jgi:pimeloyl-ACP methyl ester carboxylesterase
VQQFVKALMRIRAFLLFRGTSVCITERCNQLSFATIDDMLFRTRFRNGIVAEFTPPTHARKRQKIIVLCDGMPSMPRKQPLVEFLSQKGYWVFYPRYRGAWESDGVFLERSPHQDILDVIHELPRGVKDCAFGKRFSLSPDEVFVIGGSFGGAAALLCSLDAGVRKVIANCPVVDWSILRSSERVETSNPSYVAYIREAFGRAYNLSDRNWKKLYAGKFYNPAYHIREMTGSKIMMFHAKDDPHIPWRSVERFARGTGAKLKLLSRGGHVGTDFIVRKYWQQIERFFRQ